MTSCTCQCPFAEDTHEPRDEGGRAREGRAEPREVEIHTHARTRSTESEREGGGAVGRGREGSKGQDNMEEREGENRNLGRVEERQREKCIRKSRRCEPVRELNGER